MHLTKKNSPEYSSFRATNVFELPLIEQTFSHVVVIFGVEDIRIYPITPDLDEIISSDIDSQQLNLPIAAIFCSGYTPYVDPTLVPKDKKEVYGITLSFSDGKKGYTLQDAIVANIKKLRKISKCEIYLVKE